MSTGRLLCKEDVGKRLLLMDTLGGSGQLPTEARVMEMSPNGKWFKLAFDYGGTALWEGSDRYQVDDELPVRLWLRSEEADK